MRAEHGRAATTQSWRHEPEPGRTSEKNAIDFPPSRALCGEASNEGRAECVGPSLISVCVTLLSLPLPSLLSAAVVCSCCAVRSAVLRPLFCLLVRGVHSGLTAFPPRFELQPAMQSIFAPIVNAYKRNVFSNLKKAGMTHSRATMTKTMDERSPADFPLPPLPLAASRVQTAAHSARLRAKPEAERIPLFCCGAAPVAPIPATLLAAVRSLRPASPSSTVLWIEDDAEALSGHSSLAVFVPRAHAHFVCFFCVHSSSVCCCG